MTLFYPKNTTFWENHPVCEKNFNPPSTFVILTKVDLLSPKTRKLREAKTQKIANKINAEFWSCSSSTNENVDELFNRAVSLVFMQSCFEEIADRDGAGFLKKSGKHEKYTKPQKAVTCEAGDDQDNITVESQVISGQNGENPKLHRKLPNSNCPHKHDEVEDVNNECNVINSPIFEVPGNFAEIDLNGTVNLGDGLGRSVSQGSFYGKNSYCCGN